MSNGLFLRALQRGEAHEVAMDEVRSVNFTGQSLRSVGTRNLNGCTAVMIVSQHGAVLAHIPPRPAAARRNDPEAGDQHCAAKMTEMAAIYRTNQRFFPTDKPSWIISAMWEDEIALPSQKRIIETKLQEMGLNPSSANYRAVMPPQTDNNAKGTVFIDARTVGTPRVYVEDILVGGTPTLTRGEANTLVKPESRGEAGSQAAQTISRHSQQDARHAEHQDSRHSQQNSRHSQQDSRHSQQDSRHSQQDSRHSQQDSQRSQQDSQEESRQSQQDALRRVHDGLMEAESHDDFVRIANELKTRFRGQSAEFQRRFLEVVKRVRDERQRRRT